MLILLGLIFGVLVVANFFVYRKIIGLLKDKQNQLLLLKEQNNNLKEKSILQEQKANEKASQLALKNREIVSLLLQASEIKNRIEEILKNTKPKELSNQVKKEIRFVLKEKRYWAMFHKRFVEMHPLFLTKLRENFPCFSQGDLDLCVLLKLRMDNTEIARLIGISHQSVITKKYRLRKKLTRAQVKQLDEMLEI